MFTRSLAGLSIFSIHATELTSIPILRSLYFFLRSGGDNENGQTAAAAAAWTAATATRSKEEGRAYACVRQVRR